MRFVDVLLSIPGLLLALTMIILLGFGTVNVAIAVGIGSVAAFARLSRAEVVRVRRTDYVEAAFGSGGRYSPCCAGTCCRTRWARSSRSPPCSSGCAILAISTLGFLGYGAPPPTPEWGLLIAEGRNYLATAWWLTTLPGPVVVSVVLAADRISRSLGGRPRKGPGMSLLDGTRSRGLLQRQARGRGSLLRPSEPARSSPSSASPAPASRPPRTRSSGCCPGTRDRWTRARSCSATPTSPPGPRGGCESVRGARIGLVPQDPANSLDPVKTIGAQVGEVLRIHGAATAGRSPAGSSTCSPASACRRRRRWPGSTRTSCRAACVSACSSPSPSPWSPA